MTMLGACDCPSAYVGATAVMTTSANNIRIVAFMQRLRAAIRQCTEIHVLWL
jgi:hypothetical protein